MNLPYSGPLRNCLLITLGLAALTTFVHCASNAEGSVGSDESEHTEGDPTNENSVYSWVEADFASFSAASARIGTGVELPPDDPITVRLQRWADAFDATVRIMVKENAGQELAAPRPVIVVYNSRTNNAWASTARTCLGRPVDLSGIPAPGAPIPLPGVDGDAGAAPVTNISLYASNVAFGQGACAEATNWPSKSGATRWLERHSDFGPAGQTGTPCRYEWTGDRLSVVGANPDGGPYSGCTLSTYGRPADLSNLEAVTYRSSQYIYFTTRILQSLPDEKAVAMVVAHELAHFYKAHGSRHGTYNYFYEQKTPPVPGKPEPVADSAELQQRLQQLSPYFPSPITGSLMSERLRPLILDLVAAMQNGFNPPRAPEAAPFDASCTGLYTGIAPYVNELRYRGAVPSPAAIAKYLEVEKEFINCAVMTKVGPNDQIPTSNMQSLLYRNFGAGASLVPTAAPGATPPSKMLSDLFGELQGKAKELDFDSMAFKAMVVARKLGIYTMEQEADDLSMELMTKTGLDATETSDAWARWMESRIADPSQAGRYASDGIDPKECLALYRAGWMKADANGVMQPVSIPLGDLHEPHHGSCYRIYNLTRERDAHRFVTVGTVPTFETPWSEIRAAVDAAFSTLPETPAPPAPPLDADDFGIVDTY
ncbi:MAG: hypothetical protein KIT84_35510 [Labilithrix sp.]|nr:hypothetical protein [Labilithrix sp.]MCW5816360.1 hypothetical protein [Labilithrix sp.]